LAIIVETCTWVCSHNGSLCADDDAVDQYTAPCVYAFGEVLLQDLPLSAPLSLCLVESICTYTQRLVPPELNTSPVWPDRGQDKQFITKLLACNHYRSKILFSSWCLYHRIKNMITLRDPALQYLLHCMTAQLLGVHASEEILCVVVCNAVCTACCCHESRILDMLYAPSQSDFILIAKDMDDVVLKFIAFLDSVLSVFQMFISTFPHCFASPFLWMLNGLQAASAGIKSSEHRGCFNALMFLISFKCGCVKEYSTKEVRMIISATVFFLLIVL
jgi:hypothetical protein